MKERISRILFPLAVVLVAAVQALASASSGHLTKAPARTPSEVRDTVIYKTNIYTKFRAEGYQAETDTSVYSEADSLADTVQVLTARDTIFPPDSLRDTDPFRYKYYVALLDSLTHKQVRDSLIFAGDSLDWPRLDSLYYSDSTIRAKREFELWYASLDKQARKRYDFEEKMKVQQRKADSILHVKDSLRALRDSIRESTPRILETAFVPDSMQYKRLLNWTREPYFNNIRTFERDTTYNYWFNDYPFMRDNVNVSYLGISGSPVQPYDVQKRGGADKISFYEPIETYSYSPSTLPMFNTKTPYTELAYWGTLFANTENEEADLHILTTQNIWPSFNFTLGYDRNGANGLLAHENVDNRTFHASANYLGKKYAAHGGYIYNKMSKSENGGVTDTFWIRDTTVGAREVPVWLSNADDKIKKNTIFLDQTYRIPFTFLKDLAHRKDSTYVRDTLDTDVTTAFIGHSSEFTVISRVYNDQISTSAERKFYNNQFFLNPDATRDSLNIKTFENKLFIKLQPWSRDAIVSNLNVGIGNRIRSHYMFRPLGYLNGGETTVWNSTYLYGGAEGTWRKNLAWNATGYFTFLGHEAGDFGVNADARINLYPFRRARKSPLSIGASFETTLDEPEFYQQHYYSNHYVWDNDFSKISTTKITGRLDIPRWKFSVEGGYTLLANNIYYDSLGVVRQNATPMSVGKLEVRKDFRVSAFHFDNSALFQVSSNEDVLPVPAVALNLKWYLQFDVVKDVMQVQLGANVLYTTKWYAPSYVPALGVFRNQTAEKFGDCPYIDVFANIQWKRACVFVKLLNAGMGWPSDSADYFSAAGYIRPQRAFKFGIYWPFYLQTKENKSVSDRAGSFGGSSSSGGGGGLGSLRSAISSR